MKISRSRLSAIIAEEVRLRLVELANPPADEEPPVKKKSKGQKPGSGSADEDPVRRDPGPKGAAPMDSGAANASTPDLDQDEDPDGPAADGGQPDPEQEKSAEKDAEDAVDQDGEGGEEPSGAVNDEVSGKTVQAITIDPDSKILPGAKEVILSFNESTDALRLLVTPTGQVKFFWRGQLHDLP